MPRPIQATIHTQSLEHNLSVIRRHAADAKLWAVIKANAYGHGIARVLPAMRAADGLALLDLNEAQWVRQYGWRGPVLLLEGAFELRDLEHCSRLNLWHVVHCESQIDMLAAHKTHVPHRVFLKLNSGMNRLGFTPAQYRSAWVRLNALPQVEEITHMTHFSDADSDRGVMHQVRVFNTVVHDLPGERSLSNSAAILRHAQVQGDADWVRAGIALYGSAPDYPQHAGTEWALQPAMTLSAAIVGVQNLQVGDTVGYGSTFVANRAMRIGIVACGYADGYPRICPTGTPVLIAGRRSHTVGRVSMDMLAVDLTEHPEAGMGSTVTLWGKDAGGAILDIDEIAAHAQTISYELMCALAARVPVQVEE